MRWQVVGATLLAAVVVAPSALAGNGNIAGNGNGKAKPLDPAEAQVLAATSGYSLGTSFAAVSPAAALAAASLPGATTAVAPEFTAPALAVAASTACFSWQSGWHWGTWPYDQEVWDHTYYCADVGNYITYRTTTVTAGGTLCGVESRDNWIASGGIGYFWMVVHAQARFSCPTVIPYISLHPTDWLETAYNAWGNAAQVGHS
jgi:hypothetical protein